MASLFPLVSNMSGFIVATLITDHFIAGSGNPAKRQFECLSCPGGYYCLNGTYEPTPCGAGYFSDNGQFQCEPCRIG